MAESGYGSYAQTGHRKRRVKAYLAWVTAQGHNRRVGRRIVIYNVIMRRFAASHIATVRIQHFGLTKAFPF